MKLLIILVAIGLEKYAQIGGLLKRFLWFDTYLQSIEKLFSKQQRFLQSWLAVFVIVLPIVITVGLIYWLIQDFAFGLVGLLLNLFILLYCLGPDDLYHQLRCTLRGEHDDACEKTLFEQVPKTVQLDDSHKLSQAILILANERFFAVIFWFILLGPIGAVTYRLTVLLRHRAENNHLELASCGREAVRLQQLLDWIPARFTAILYMVVGSFQAGIKQWCQCFFSGLGNNIYLLQQCGMAALGNGREESESALAALDLVEHALIVILVIIAIFTLGAWIV